MKCAIIGGGFTGLSAAITLTDANQEVVVFEQGASLGGLAGSFHPTDWQWGLEMFYHHIFTNDREIIAMAKKVGLPARFYSPLTTCFIHKKEVQLDSPISVLKFKYLSLAARLWMGVGILVLKMIPRGVFLERFRVTSFLPWLIGKEGYSKIWEKLMKAKFGPYAEKINMAWFWSRVAKRTKRLGYFDGGFGKLLETMGGYIEKGGGEIRLGREVKKIIMKGNIWEIDGEKYDRVIVTVPAPIVDKIAPDIGVKWPKIDYLWSQTLILELKKGFMNGYWMNILENKWPFLVAVEQTNLINKKMYGNRTILYLGNYLPEEDPRLNMKEGDLEKLYLPYLKKINSNLDESDIINKWSFKSPFAQPVFPINYGKSIPSIKTRARGLYVGNMSMVYPNDRGTNYAVKMGIDMANILLSEI